MQTRLLCFSFYWHIVTIRGRNTAPVDRKEKVKLSRITRSQKSNLQLEFFIILQIQSNYCFGY
jgi:hypothetical protein